MREIYFLYIWNTERDWNLDLCEKPLSIYQKSNHELQVYPNPTSQIARINQVVKRAQVYNTSGSVLLEERHTSAIDLNELPSGVYFLRLTHNEKAIIKKVVKI